MTIKEFLEREVRNRELAHLCWFRNSIFFWFAGKSTDIDSDALRMIAKIELGGQNFTVVHVGFVGRVDNPKLHYNGMFAVECQVVEHTKRKRYWVCPNVNFIPREDPAPCAPSLYAN